MRCALLLATCLLAAAPVGAQGDASFGTPGGEFDHYPTRFVKFEGANLGLFLTRQYPGDFAGLGLASITCVFGRVRFGIESMDFVGSGLPDDWFGGTLLPIHVGCTILSNPKKTAFFYGAVPDVYAEVKGAWFGLHSPDGPYIRAAICCDVDYFGVGCRFEAGALNLDCYLSHRPDSNLYLYAGLRVRLLTFGIGF